MIATDIVGDRLAILHWSLHSRVPGRQLQNQFTTTLKSHRLPYPNAFSRASCGFLWWLGELTHRASWTNTWTS